MARYLNPPKICILVLITLYCDDYVPKDAAIPILSFIVASVHRADSSKSNASLPWSSSMTIVDLEKILSCHHSKVTGRTLFQAFLNRLWSIDCLHALHEFFAELSTYLRTTQHDGRKMPDADQKDSTRTLLSLVSPMGVFVRKSQVEFTRLQFDDSVKLWTALVRFRRPVESVWRRMHPSAPSDIPDVNILTVDEHFRSHLLDAVYGSIPEDDTERDTLSADEVERMLEFQLERLQSKEFNLSRVNNLLRIRRIWQSCPRRLANTIERLLCPHILSAQSLAFCAVSFRTHTRWRCSYVP